MTAYVATAEIEIDSPAHEVWSALTDPQQIEQFMFGTHVVTDWKPGSPIVWSGEYQGRAYEDKGEILEVERAKRLKMTHFSSLSGQDDVPENYHTVSYEVDGVDGGTQITLDQDGNESQEQAEQFSQNWQTSLNQLKEHVEG